MEVVKKYNDTELLVAVKSPISIDDAIKFMYREYYGLLKNYTCQNSGNDDDAQDIFQEVLVAFIDLAQKDKFRGESSIKTFLFALNRNMWLNELKKRGRAEKRDTIFEKEKDTVIMDVSHFITQSEMQKQIFTIVESLGETCKKILLAFYYENLPIKEILTTLDYESEQAVRNKKCKCLKQLEQLLITSPNLAQTLKTALNHE
jgi:RNA polymerase sigma factor (sigma-70 family)